jgi:hypothetical protein
MKYKMIYYVAISLLIILGSCTKKIETDGLSKVTYFPEMDMSGDDVILVAKGSTFSEPGVAATENGANIDVKTSVGGVFRGYSGTTLNTESPDKYVITYTATNSDGFNANLERTVWVVATGDLVNSIEGLYTSTVKRGSTLTAQYTDMKYILIYKTGANTYAITCAIGGYYDIGRAYGPGYAALGAVITANNIATNDFSITRATFPLWGNISDITNFAVNAANKTITFVGNTDIANGTFTVTLKQVQL